MAFDFKKKGYQSGFGAVLEGLGDDDIINNRFKRRQESDRRQFELSKMEKQNQYQTQRGEAQEAKRQANRLSIEELRNQNILARQAARESKSKKEKIDPNELTAFITGKFTPAMEQNFGKLSEEDQIAVIRELAGKRGYQESGEREETSGGFFGMGAKKKKFPTYSSSENQFQR